VVAGIQRIAGLQRSDAYTVLVHELVKHLVDHDHPLGRHAHLASVPMPPEYGPVDRLVHVCILENYERVGTSELERALLTALAA